jgi:1-acyl-sn-glycerol-3-phosphate acyltransferase
MATSPVAIWRGLRLSEHIMTGMFLTILLNREENQRRNGRQFPTVIQWWHRRLCKILGIELEITGNIADGHTLLVANHVSWIDIPVIGAITNTIFLSKSEVRKWPLIGWLAGAAGTLFFSRGSGATNELVEKMSQHISEKGRPVLVFPEGTTTDGTEVKRFFPRLFSVVTDAGIPVQPIAIRYTCEGHLDTRAAYIDDDSFPVHLGQTLKRKPSSKVQITFCEPIQPDGLSRKELADITRERIVEALEAA